VSLDRSNTQNSSYVFQQQAAQRIVHSCGTWLTNSGITLPIYARFADVLSRITDQLVSSSGDAKAKIGKPTLTSRQGPLPPGPRRSSHPVQIRSDNSFTYLVTRGTSCPPISWSMLGLHHLSTWR